MTLRARVSRALVLFELLIACSRHDPGTSKRESKQFLSSARSTSGPSPFEGPPQLLYLPDAAEPPSLLPGSPPAPAMFRRGPCPPDMVAVRGAYCIDRFEATLVDALTGKRLSPYYHPTPDATRREFQRWQELKSQAATQTGRDLPVPAPPEWEIAARRFEPMATSVQGSEPNGYLSGEIAERACRRAGKRLCTPEEWVIACRGQENRPFPYGQTYEAGRCNVFRESHPAELLHGNSSEGHLDPRLNLVQETDGQPLLRHTGATPSCKSEWGDDAVFDMVGNLDEWVDDPGGTFVGGFYSRATSRGCDARVDVHAYEYFDYSLGTRCCKSL